jgi:hypothetical protein
VTEQEVVKARETLASFRKLVQCPGWAALVEVVTAQQKLRDGTVLRKPLESADKVFEQEFVKGEAAGMGVVLALPQQIIDAIRADLQLEGVISDEDAA